MVTVAGGGKILDGHAEGASPRRTAGGAGAIDTAMDKKYLLALACVIMSAIGFAFFSHLRDNPPPDFLPFYLGGKLAASGQIRQIYDRSAYQPLIMQLHRDGERDHPYGAYYFIRPAFEAYLYAPFTLFSYRTASMLAVLCNFVLLGLLVWKLPLWFEIRPSARLAVRACLVVFFPFLWSISVGQDTLLLTLIAAYACKKAFDGSEGLAGTVLALGVYKPHLIWAMPLALMAGRKWKMAWSFLAVAVMLAALSFASVGMHGVEQWLELVRAPSSDITPAQMGNLRAVFLHGGSIIGGTALTLSLGCFVAVLRFGDLKDKLSAAILTGLLLSPHTYWQDYSLWALVAMLAPQPYARFALLLPWLWVYPRKDELAAIVVSLAYLSFLAFRNTLQPLHSVPLEASGAGIHEVRPV